MTNKKMLFVVNPKSGKARIKNHLLDITDLFIKAGYEVHVHITQKPGDAVEVIKNREDGYNIIVCSGGDGTLDEVVNGMVLSNRMKPIGYIPAGSTNDFANSLGLPSNMKKAAQIVVEGEKFACDIGSFNSEIFVYVAAFGMFTDVSYGTEQELKNALGHMAYVLEGVKRLASIKSYRLKISYADTVLEGDFIYGMVTNSVSVGGFKNLTGKNVELNDGEFEVMLVKRPANALELNKLIAALWEQKTENEFIYWFKTDKLQIEAKEPVAWTLDGEFGGEHKIVKIRDLKQAMEIIVPKI